jgi:tetratricopeptide (TPR) repeat protein
LRAPAAAQQPIPAPPSANICVYNRRTPKNATGAVNHHIVVESMKRRSASKVSPGNLSLSQDGTQARRRQSVLVGPTPSAAPSSLPVTVLAAGVIVLASAAAYSGSFTGPFILDDTASILDNATIRQLWPIWRPLNPPSDHATLCGRPLLNLSLAINYAVSGQQVWSYHVANLVIHILAALVLFGILRRTFLLPTMRDRWGSAATPLALAIALLWALHPLQTESVTYIVQRAESLVGLFYLATLYCFIRGATITGSWRWQAVSVVSCLAGMATKEVMASVPLIVVLYDRAFCAGSFREAWRRRYGYYVALGATWVLLGWMVRLGGSRAGSAGFGTQVGWWEYLCTQFGAIVHYLRLSVWPSPLVLDYGAYLARGFWEIAPYALVVGILGIATTAALWRLPKIGFLGACFFGILAPTSSVIPLATQTIAEHRMYLPLAAVATAIVTGSWAAGGWFVNRGIVRSRAVGVAGALLATLVCAAMGILTFLRGMDYRSDISIWADTVAKAPNNARAHHNYGLALARRGQSERAIEQYEIALKIQPDFVFAHNGLGAALAERGQAAEAMACYEKALEIDPYSADAHYNLGRLQALGGRLDQAIAHFRRALQIRPDYVMAHNNLGALLAERGDVEEAIAHYRQAMQIDPRHASSRYNLATILAGRGQWDESIAQLQALLDIEPDNAKARSKLDIVESQRQSLLKALAERRELLRARPDDIALLNDIAWTLATNPNASMRNGVEAIELARRAVQLSNGREPAVLGTLAAACAEAGRFAEAVQTAHQALELATRQNKQSLVRSIEATIPLYEAQTPLHTLPERSPRL